MEKIGGYRMKNHRMNIKLILKGRFVNKKIFLVFCLVLAITPILASQGVIYIPRQLTDNDFRDNLNGMDGRMCVWHYAEGDDNENLEIFVYDKVTDTITQITDNTYEDRIPKIHNGLITWLGKPDGPTSDYEIFLYRVDTQQTIQITDNELNEIHPRVQDGYVTWYAWEGDNMGLAEIYLYTVATGETLRITHNGVSDYSPKVKDGYILWHGSSGYDQEIFLYDISAQTTMQITDNLYNDDSPGLSNGLIAWRALVNGKIQLFLYDIATTETLMVAEPRYSWSWSFHNGLIAYAGHDGTNKELYLYNHFERTTYKLTENMYSDIGSICIQNGKIIFDANGGMAGIDRELFLYDTATDILTQLTDNSFNDYAPMYNDGFLAWMGMEGNPADAEIYLLNLAITTTVDVNPDTLNLKSNGEWITVYIELPEGYDVEAINIASLQLTLEGQSFIVDMNAPSTVNDYDGDMIPDLMVNFNRAELVTYLGVENYYTEIIDENSLVEFLITGTVAGTPFEGSDWIRIIRPGK